MKWNQLTANDIAILHFLNRARFATTRQLARLFYSDSPSPQKLLFVAPILPRKD